MAHTKLPSVTDYEKLLPFLKTIVSQQSELSFSVDMFQYVIALGIAPLQRVCYPFPILEFGLLLCLQDTSHALNKLFLFDPVIPFDKYVQSTDYF